MKKIARLKWIEETFGKEFVSPYIVCMTPQEISYAVSKFEDEKRTWGLRTDTKDGSVQGYNLPFVHHGTPEKASEVWNKWGDKLAYIVVENILVRRLSAVAIKLDQEHVLFEWNDKEHTISQRDMYKRPENLRQIVLGPSNYFFPWGVGEPIRGVRPSYAADQGFDRIYDVMVHSDVDEATFTLRQDGRVIVW